jgi:hypothetical protein
MLSLSSLLEQRIPLLGHRNWVVIADMAYPQQSNPGIETIYVGGEHLEMVQEVLRALATAPHVRPTVYVDQELAFIAEEHAPGISDFRDDLYALLEGKEAKTLPHEEIIHQLDKAAQCFSILILKTGFTLPYTSVFLRLDCGYWTEEAEQELRESMEKGLLC